MALSDVVFQQFITSANDNSDCGLSYQTVKSMISKHRNLVSSGLKMYKSSVGDFGVTMEILNHCMKLFANDDRTKKECIQRFLLGDWLHFKVEENCQQRLIGQFVPRVVEPNSCPLLPLQHIRMDYFSAHPDNNVVLQEQVTAYQAKKREVGQLLNSFSRDELLFITKAGQVESKEATVERFKKGKDISSGHYKGVTFAYVISLAVKGTCSVTTVFQPDIARV